MSRSYLVFGSDDEVNWELLNTVEASGGEQACNQARKQESHRHYAACPERNWTSGEPEVEEREPLIRWRWKGREDQPAKQMTVEDALAPEKKQEKEEAIREAKEALAAKPEPTTSGVEVE
jgi:hypothetical protein